MTITVFGASGKVGRLVVAEALRREQHVRAFVHEHNPYEPEANLTIVQGDIYSGDDVDRAVEGANAVVSCLGSWGTRKRNVLTSAMQAIIPAMQSHKITRIVTLTGSGAASPDRKPPVWHRLFMAGIAWTPAGKVFADGEEHMRLLAGSELQWTTLRSPIMNNLDGTGYRLAARMGNHFRTISRKAVAKCMLDQLQSTDWSGRAPVVRRSHHV